VTNYDDGRVKCTDQGIVIRHYYIPGGDRAIRYSEIREARQVPLHWIGKWRVAGTGDFIHWFSFDPRRYRKQTALVLYTDGRIRPVITPDDPALVAGELTAHGVNVTTGRERGLI
jgi:hypothetical protein